MPDESVITDNHYMLLHPALGLLDYVTQHSGIHSQLNWSLTTLQPIDKVTEDHFAALDAYAGTDIWVALATQPLF